MKKLILPVVILTAAINAVAQQKIILTWEAGTERKPLGVGAGRDKQFGHNRMSQSANIGMSKQFIKSGLMH